MEYTLDIYAPQAHSLLKVELPEFLYASCTFPGLRLTLQAAFWKSFPAYLPMTILPAVSSYQKGTLGLLETNFFLSFLTCAKKKKLDSKWSL